MKVFIIAAVAACSAMSAPLAAHAAGLGSTFEPAQMYASIGYAGAKQDDITLGAIQARLGLRAGKYLGVEGEVAVGVKNADVTVGGGTATVKLSNQEAIYGVGFWPISPKFDVFARVGYGHTNVSASSGGGSASGTSDSVNYGAGGQYFFTSNDGVRADYTRHHYNGGGGADVWSIAYVRKF
ncbi:MAG TPA: porin family protein [Caulobacteraceae bacterium]